MRCEQVRERLADRLTGAAADEEALRGHLRDCAGCRGEAAALEALWSGLGAVEAPQPDSAVMRARFASMLEGYEHGRQGVGVDGQTRPYRGLPGRAASRLAALAAAAALVAVGVAAGRATAPASSPPAGEVAALRDELRETRQMVALSLLRQPSASDRLRGVGWSERLEEPGGEVVDALLQALRHDPNVNVRLAAIDALVRFADRQGVRLGAIEALESATAPLVQIALIDFVVATRDPGSITALKRLAGDPSSAGAVRERAARGLAQLGSRS